MVVAEQKEIILDIGNSTYFDRSVLRYSKAWEYQSDSVDRVNIDHVLEYLDGQTRIHFINELHRVLKPGGRAIVKVPYWASTNAYSDPYLVWPPFTEMSMQYLVDKDFRERNGIQYHDLVADFYVTRGYSYAPDWHVRSDATREYAVKHNVGVVTQVVYALTKT